MQLKKLLLIAIKDLRLIFSDLTALMMMLLAPFVLTIGMGALTGYFSGGGGGYAFSDMPIEIVNKDDGALGQALIAVFESPELDELVAASVSTDVATAQAMVDNDQRAAAIFIPDGFTESFMTPRSNTTQTVQIEFYANPTQPTSAGILRSILDQFLNQVEIGRVSAEVIVSQLNENNLISSEQAVDVGIQIGQEMGEVSANPSSIEIKNNLAISEGLPFDILAYIAPGFAMMFLMLTVSYGAQSLLVENRTGTLPRLMVSPTWMGSVLGGKMLGVFLTAVAQLLILIGGTTLLFQLNWGDPWGVILLVLAAAFGATGWGILFASILKTPGQVGITGTVSMLLFGILGGGGFLGLSRVPGWIGIIGKITPNAWATDGFEILAAGGKLQNIQQNILALMAMGGILFTIAIIAIRNRGLMRK